jgi:hypothetical protein
MDSKHYIKKSSNFSENINIILIEKKFTEIKNILII